MGTAARRAKGRAEVEYRSEGVLGNKHSQTDQQLNKWEEASPGNRTVAAT